MTTPGGTSNAVAYTYVAVPVLTSLTPNEGPLPGGNTVTLTGSHFTGASAVSFGATPATSFTVDSDTQITATVPAGPGTVNVTVTTPGGTSNAVAYTLRRRARAHQPGPEPGTPGRREHRRL